MGDTYNQYPERISDNNLYPPYTEVLQSKKESYPIQYEEDFTEIEAKVRLQALVDKTVERLFKTIKKVEHGAEVTAIYKWGMDGSSGNLEFKQRFSDPNNSDATIFCSNMVPLLLKNRNKIIWINDHPNSTRYYIKLPKLTYIILHNVHNMQYISFGLYVF